MAKIRFRTDTLTLDRTVTFPDADVDFTAYIDERSQDAVGSILTDSSTINFIYDDGVPSITAEVLDSPLLGGDLPSFYLDRANHTGTQLAATISDFATAVETVGDGLYVELAGDTMTGPLVMTTASAVGDGTGNAALEFNGAAGNVSRISLNSGSTSRWAVRKASGAEGGSDTGAPFQISAFTDAGVLIDSPIEITRAAGGAVLVNRPLRVGDGLAGTEELFIDSPAGNAAITSYQSGSITRWAWLKTSTAETGADAGSDLHLRAHNDAGTIIDTPISIVRAAGGDIDFARNLDMGGNSIGNALSVSRTGGPLRIGSAQSADAALSGGDGAWQVYSTGSAGARASIVMSNSNTSSIARMILGKTNAIPFGTLAAPGSGSIVGQLEWQSTTTVPDFFSAGYVRLGHLGTATATGGDMEMTFAVHDGTASVVPLRIRSTQILGPDGSAASPAWTFGAELDVGMYRAGANTLGFATNSTEGPIINSAQQLLVGNPGKVALAMGALTPSFQMQGTGPNNAGIGLFRANVSAGGNPNLVFARNNDGTLTGVTAVASGHVLGQIEFAGSDGVDLATRGAAIRAIATSAATANRIATRIDMFTASGASDDNLTLNLQLNNVGQLLVNPGTSAVPAYSFIGDTDTGISSPNPNEIDFATAGVSRVVFDIYGGIFAFNNNRPTTVDGSQHALVVNQSAQANAVFRKSVGNANAATLEFVKSRGSIASPTVILDGDSIGVMRFEGYNNAGAYVESAAITARVEGTVAATVPGMLVFRTAPAGGSSTERMTIQPNGEVIVGTAGAGPYGAVDSAVTPVFQVNTSNADNADRSVLISHFSATANAGPILELAKSGSSTLGTMTAVASGSVLGTIAFDGADGTDFSRGAGIAAVTTALATAGDVPADLQFNTKADGVALSTKLVLTGDGRLYGTALHNNSGSVTGTTNQYIASGTWTPTLTNTTNIAASTASVGQWIRVGNVVNASVRLTIDPTAAGSCLLGISLPVASLLSSIEQLSGTGRRQGSSEGGVVYADGTNDRASFDYVATLTTNGVFFLHFTYVIL